jgi:hypothetical protein
MSQSMRPPTEKEFNKLASELAKQLAGYHPTVQGAAISKMAVVWLRNYRPKDWEKVLQEFTRQVRTGLEGSANDGTA